MSDSRCPDLETLRAYRLLNLPDSERKSVTAHLSACTACQTALTALDDAAEARLREPALPATPAARAQHDDAMSGIVGDPVMNRAATKSPDASQRATESWGGLPGPPGPVPMPTPVPLRYVGQYEVLEKLGEGGMGAVYKARHARLKRIVAIKMLPEASLADPKAIARFEREMKAVGRLDHPNIVRAMDARKTDGTWILVMEYVAGMDLSRVLSQTKPLPISDACEIIRQVATGLQCAHENGLVHRDIKPSNVMLTSDGLVKILDLGLARLGSAQATDAVHTELTSAGTAMGTVDYIAPEQITDSHSVDIRADIYSLGCTFYKLLTGRAPFSGPVYKEQWEKIAGHLRDAPPPLRHARPDVGRELASVIERMMAKDREARHATPQDVVASLAPFCTQADLRRLAQEAIGAVQGVEKEKPPSGTESGVASAMTSTHPNDAAQPAAGTTCTWVTGVQRASRPISWPLFRELASRRVVAVVFGFLVAAIIVGAVVLRNKHPSVQETVLSPSEGASAEWKPSDDADKPHAAVADAASLRPGTPGLQPTGVELPPWQLPAGAPPPAIAPFTAKDARRHIDAWAKYLDAPVEIENSIWMKFRLIPPGDFDMGAKADEIEEGVKWVSASDGEPLAKERATNACLKSGPVHRVRISKPFYLGKHEVTRGQFRQFVSRSGYKTEAERAGNEYHWDRSWFKREDEPAVFLTWDDVDAFCRWLRNEEHRQYRLPTEAEWEYACRAGTATRTYAGDMYDSLQGYENVPDMSMKTKAVDASQRAKAWATWDDKYCYQSPVGQFLPNPFGLCDMLGNVAELCEDGWNYDCCTEAAAIDPYFPGPIPVARGGTYATLNPFHCGSGARGVCPGFCHVGFRLVIRLSVQPP